MADEIKQEPDTFKRWQGRIQNAENIREQAGQKLGWKRFLDYFNNKYERALNLSIPVVVINEVYAYVKTAVAGLYFRDPHVAVNPKRKQDIVPCAILEQSVNYYWREKKIKRQIKKCIAESKIVGFSFAKVGYDADIEQENVAGNVNEFVKNEDFWVTHIPYCNVLYDNISQDPLFDARWVAHWCYKPTEYLQKKYKNDQIKSTYKVKTDENRYVSRESDIKQTKVFEIWDKDSKSKIVYCDGYNGILEEIPPIEEGCIGPYKMEGFPIVMLRFNDIIEGSEFNYPMSEIAPQEPQILEEIKLRSMQLNHVKRFSRQVFTKKDFLDPANKEKYERGIDGSIIECEGEPTSGIYSPSYPNLQQDIYPILTQISIDKDKMSGQSQLEQGAAGASKTRTLGELELVQKGSGNRRNEQLDVVEDFCEEIASKIIQLQKQFFDIQKIARITGDVPEQILQALAQAGLFDGVSIKFNRENIQGEYDIDVQMGSALPMNKENRIQVVNNLIRFGPALGLTPESRAAKALGQFLVKEMEIKPVELAYEQDLIERSQPKQPSMEEMMRLSKMKAGTENTQVDTQLKQKRVEKSDLDMTNKILKNRMDANKFVDEGNV